ncbi:MAG: rhodanese-like domain-containing protein [Armatimonadota bacterium]|jgi:rhodanese-related sulfurtransferase
MELRRWWLLCVAMAGAAVVFAGCGGGGLNLPELPTVGDEQLWGEVFSGSPPRVVDVRDASDYEEAHIPTSESTPHGRSVTGAAVATRVPGEDIVIVGQTETDARRAAIDLLGPGETARALAGGLNAWDCGLDINDVQLKHWIDGSRNVRLIDVRTYSEWWAERIDGSENLPVDEIDVWAPTIAPSEEVVVICAGGVRSAQARDDLAGRGLTRVHNLLGGIGAWRYDLVCG